MIRAIFTGADGSMGFRTGQIYRFRSRMQLGQIVIYTGKLACPYSSLEAFLRNWDVQEVMRD